MFEEDEPEEDGLAERYREPDPEPDPEADLPDPESELPTVPAVDIPEPEPGEVSSELLGGFWVLVLLFNAALLLVSLGTLMVVFDVERPIGALVALLGLLLARRGYNRYRVLDERHRAGELTGGADGDDAEEDGDAGSDGAGERDPATDDERNG